MPELLSRRTLLAGVPAILFAGCSADSDGDTDPDTESPTSTQSPTMNAQPTDNPLDRLPEPSPLGESLRSLVAASDPGTAAGELGLDYRDGRVKVVVLLEENGEWPSQYLGEDASGASGRIDAYVAVSDLVDLALEPDVRLVRKYEQPEAQSGSSE